jgi:pilus assembly protein CpaF
VPELCAVRPGLSPDAAREWLASSFDLGIEVARLRDGRLRVLRLTELAGVADGAVTLRDVFQFNVERAAAGGAVEGSFSSTGSIPRFVEELRLRGITIEASVFERASVR